MKNARKLRLSLFDTNVGDYDEYNPRYVLNNIDGVAEICYLIASNPPCTLNNNNISSILKLDLEVCITGLSALERINAVSIVDGKYKINFPVFLQEDLVQLKEFSKNIGETLGQQIMSLQDPIDSLIKKLAYSKNSSIERVRYHIVGCDVLDGEVIRYLGEQQLITTSKRQPGNRDYLIIGYEDNGEMQQFSENLLCSCNMYFAEDIAFGSFGDGIGNRNDMMRFFRRLQKSINTTTENDRLNISYIRLMDKYNNTIAKRGAKILKATLEETIKYNHLLEEDRNIVEFLQEIGYISIDKNNLILNCNVPVFTASDRIIISKISKMIINNISSTIKTTFNDLTTHLPRLTSIAHGVSAKDVANELWHLMFGPTNEYLVEKGFYSKPEFKPGEGRYFQCLYYYEKDDHET